MSSPVQLTGGAFQDAVGNPLANGYLQFTLSQDAQVNSNTEVGSGIVTTITLDADGNVGTSPPQSVWPNDVLVPVDTFYTVSAFSQEGQLVWGPNAVQVFSSPSPYNIGAWVPGVVNTAVPLGRLAVTSTVTTTSASAGPGTTLPAAPVGFVTININGTDYKLPFYGM